MNLSLITQMQFNSVLCDVWQNEDNDVFMTREQIGQSLEYADPKKAIENIHARNKERLDRFSVTLKMRATDGKLYDTTIYNERGIYEIARFSKQPKANAFYDWVYDLLQGLRKGEIVVHPQPEYSLPSNFKEALLMLAETVDENDQLKQQIEGDKEKVVLANAITTSDEGLLIEAAAKYMRQNGVNIGRDRLFKWLRGRGYLVSRKGREWNMPTQKTLNQGLMKIHCQLYYDSEGELKTSRQVVVTGKGLMFFINKFLHEGQLRLPLEV